MSPHTLPSRAFAITGVAESDLGKIPGKTGVELQAQAARLVLLDAGVRLMANIVDTPLDSLNIGDRVAVRWLDVNDEVTLPQFTVVGAA